MEEQLNIINMAKQKYSPNEIQGKTDDWGMDVNDVDKRPFSGASVQRYIKRQLDGKIGILHYDTGNNRYMAFADTESRDAYMDNPARTDLILGTFDAPFNFMASVSLLSPQSNVLLKGSKGHSVEFTFDITDKSGAPTMESVNVTYTIFSGGVKKKVSAQYAYGTRVSFLADEYIGDGETLIQIAVVGQDTLAATTRSVSYRVLDLTLRSDYNVGTVNDVRDNPYVQIPFYVKSSRHVILKASVDYGEFTTVMETDTYETGGAHQVDTLNLSDGKHNVRLVAQNIIDGVTYASDTVYKDFIVSRGAIDERLVLMDGVIPMGAEDSGFRLYGMRRYIPYDVTLAAFDPSGGRSDVSIALVSGGKEYAIGQKSLMNGNSETVTFTPMVSGAAKLRVRNGDVTVEIDANIEASAVQIEEITNLLELSLRAMGRSNSDADREAWTYGPYEATFSGFAWNSRSGWVDNALKINTGAAVEVSIAPLSFDPERQGLTFEMEFSTELVSDEDAVVMDLTEDGRGIMITASSISLVSGNGRTVSTRFRAGERHRVAFVIDNSPVRNSKLAHIYVDGVPSGAVDFLGSDTYAARRRMRIGDTLGAVVNVSDIRVYRRALSAQEIRNNYTLYQSSAEAMLAIYNRNDIMSGGRMDHEKVANLLPVMVVTGDIAKLENTTNKKERIVVNVRYTDRQHPERSFNVINGVMTPQGTSSMFYPKKNFRLYTNKGDGTELRTGSDTLGEGELARDRLYSFKDGAQPVDTWCLKADYAESSSTHNTGVARLWNDALANMQVSVDGSPRYVGRTKAQQAAIDSGYGHDVRTAIDGFPIVMFYHETEEDPLIFMGKYNFNNDKSTESVFGFRGIPGFDDSRVECWEQLDSGNPYGLFTGDPAGFDDNWDKAFEGRYPDGNTNTEALKRLYVWLNSCEGDQGKFNAEWKEHFDPYKVAAYYIYLMRFGGVDQTVKNAMLMTEDGDRWFFINYDNDTILGLDNDGLLSFGWDITRQTRIAGTDVYCYAGHDSLLWNMLEGCDEFMGLVPDVDQALYSARKGKLDVGTGCDNVIRMFNEEQSGKWCETIYAEDARYKYIDPYRNNSVNQLAKLQGRRSSHRAWWVQNRWNLFDGKWMTGEFRKDGISFKCQQGAAGTTLKVTAGNEMYYGIKVQTTMIQSESLGVGESHDFAIDRPLQIGTPVSVCNPSNIAGLDISNFAEYISSLDIQKVKNGLGESRLKRLVIGKAGVANSFLTAISGIENAYALQEIDITGLRLVTSLDLSQQTELRRLSARQSGLRDVSLPEGAPVSVLELPAAVQVLRLKDYPLLSSSGLMLEDGGSSVHSISIINCPNLSNDINLPIRWLASKEAEDSRCALYIDNIAWTNVDPALFLKICAAKENGMSVTLKGKVMLSKSSQQTIDDITRALGREVFSPNNEFYVYAPDAVYLSGPSTVIEGDTAQFVATVFSEHMGDVRFGLLNNSRAGVSIDVKTGLLTTTENGAPDSNLSVRATHIPTQGARVYADKEVTVKRRVYPYNVTINGNANLSTEINRFSWSCSDSQVTGKVRSEWSLTGEITNYAELASQEGNTCVVRKTVDCTETIEGALTVKLYSVTTGELKRTVTRQVTALNPDIIMTKISNPEVMAVMYANKLCANENYMTKAEAELIYDLGGMFRNGSITHFDELEFFEGVTSIGSSAFYGCTSLTSIKIPSGVTSIGSSAFVRCSSLTSIEIPSGMTRIEESVFSGCSSLASIKIPSSVTRIDRYAFASCSSLTNIKIPSGVTRIEESVFSGCSSLTSIEIPSSVTSIGTTAFYSCSSLTNIKIPSSVTSIGRSAFSGCSSLASIEIPSSVTSIEYSAFSGCSNIQSIVVAEGNNIYDSRDRCNAIIRTTSNELIVGSKNTVIPSSVTSIGFSAFSDYSSLTNIEIPSSVTSIGRSAFSGCSSLTSIKIPSGVTSIGSSAFASCSSLTSIEIPSGMTRIEESVFSQCSSLTSIEIPSSVTSIGRSAFYGCTSLTSIKIPSGVTSIGSSAFSGCSSLTSIEIPSSVTSIEASVFSGCSSLASIEIPSGVTSIEASVFSRCSSLASIEIPSGVTSIGSSAFSGCSSLTSIEIPSGVTSIEASVFSRCSSLASIEIPSGVTSIGSSAFYDCSSLTNIKIPSSVTSIGRSAFYDCSSLTSIKIPSSVTSIGSSAFSGCKRLSEIKLLAAKAPETSSDAFGYSYGNYTGSATYDKGTNMLYVPAGATGYDSGVWKDPLCSAKKCGFTISYTL